MSYSNSTNKKRQRLGSREELKQGEDLTECPICRSSPTDPFRTPCEHVFCYECISRHLQMRSNCPTCGVFTTPEMIRADIRTNGNSEGICMELQEGEVNPMVQQLLSSIGNDSRKIQEVFLLLQEHQRHLEKSQSRVGHRLLVHFLDQARKEKTEEINRLRRELEIVNVDIESIRSKMEPEPEGREDAELVLRKQRLKDHFPEFESRYFGSIGPDSGERDAALESFGDDLSKFSRYTKFTCCATLRHSARSDGSTGTGDGRLVSNIVSSIEFDRDSQFIATAGVMKRIKVFELSNILNNRVDIHYPVKELETKAKLSCLSWNPYIQNHLICSDYEGVVTLFDVQRGEIRDEFEEHEKRAWSVDFSTVNPTRFASGSDDKKVKLWSTTQPSSQATIENRAQVCCVKFNPDSEFEIAFGSADHDVHFYDLRYTRQPKHVFRGHSKAVSYVRFLDGSHLCSASTDSSLKLWDVRRGTEVRTFLGHRNEKNFVGLSVTEDYATCGSENNAVYTYFRALSRPVVIYRFNESQSTLSGDDVEDDSSQFVSSVCWCPKNPRRLLAANSQGTIKVLELQ